MKYIGIYKILNLKNKKVYIGSSTDLKQRLRTHKYQLKENKHGNTHLQASFNKYGKDNFLCEIIEITSKENLIEREIYWINYYQSLNRKKVITNLLTYNQIVVINGQKNLKNVFLKVKKENLVILM